MELNIIGSIRKFLQIINFAPKLFFLKFILKKKKNLPRKKITFLFLSQDKKVIYFYDQKKNVYF